MTPFVPTILPDLTGKPIFLSAGRNDPIVPSENVKRLSALFRAANADVTVHWHDAGHSLTEDEAIAARNWLAARRDAP